MRSIERERSGGRAHFVGGIDIVLDENRNSMQQSAGAFFFALPIEPIGQSERVGIDFDNGAKLRTFAVERIDARQLTELYLARCPAVQAGDTQLFQIEARDVFGLLAGGESRSRTAEEGAAIHLSIIRCGMVAELFMVTLTLAQLAPGEPDKVGISRAG